MNFNRMLLKTGCLIKIVIQLLGGVCASCGSTEELEIDHVSPVWKGGRHDATNLQVLCYPCHKVKTKADCVGHTRAYLAKRLIGGVR